MLRDILIQKEVSTIAPDQFFFANIWNSLLGQIKQEESAPAQFGGYGVKFPRVIHELIEKVQDKGQTASPQADQADQVAQTNTGQEGLQNEQ